MAMAPEHIKAELVRKKVKQSDVARTVGKSPQLVNDVIHGARRNHAIEREIASRIGKPVSRVFGTAA